VTRDRALKRAAEMDQRTHLEIAARSLPSPYKMFSQIRAYLLRRCEDMKTRNNSIQLLKFTQSKGVASIVLGPGFDKGLTPQHFHFDSGARLSFALTLRESDGGSQLVGFRYHYQLPDQAPASASPGFLRFDLNEAAHADALSEPRCHLHPGLEDVRLPISLHDPFEVLDRIFFVLERSV
jgi:hypothetical protein